LINFSIVICVKVSIIIFRFFKNFGSDGAVAEGEGKILIQLKDITKSFGKNVVLKKVNLDIYENEFVTLLGPSGCGKTTILRIIGGFETQDSGTIFFEGKDLSLIPAYKRPSNTVFQRYALFPHLNVFDNVAFGLRIKKTDEKIIKEKVTDVLKMVGLTGFENRAIQKMSGGQQQRVAIARALVNQPKVLLLDEPLGALDLKLRKEMHYELKRIQRETGITFIYVTHDQEEALTMSDKIVVIKDGDIQQFGTPFEIYNDPINAYVAKFIGESNIFNGVIKSDTRVVFDDHVFECEPQGFAKGEEVDVVVRPEDIRIMPLGSGKLDGVVEDVVFKGTYYEIDVKTSGFTYQVETTKSYPVGKEVSLSIAPQNIHIMVKMK
jgi:spermidine/putrescine transport system ATP-binding protein